MQLTSYTLRICDRLPSYRHFSAGLAVSGPVVQSVSDSSMPDCDPDAPDRVSSVPGLSDISATSFPASICL